MSESNNFLAIYESIGLPIYLFGNGIAPFSIPPENLLPITRS